MAAESAGRKSIEYVMTTAGPEPLDNIQHPLDREHYVTKTGQARSPSPCLRHSG